MSLSLRSGRRKESGLLGPQYERRSTRCTNKGPYIAEWWLWPHDPPDHRSAGGLYLAPKILTRSCPPPRLRQEAWPPSMLTAHSLLPHNAEAKQTDIG